MVFEGGDGEMPVKVTEMLSGTLLGRHFFSTGAVVGFGLLWFPS